MTAVAYFKELYKYEVKKILVRKIVWITLLICMVGIVVTVCANLTGTYYVDGEAVDTHYHMFQVDQAYYKALSGRTIDQELLDEMWEAYGRILPGAERYTLTEEYQTYARPYSDIFNLVWSWTGRNAYYEKGRKPDEATVYAARKASIEEDWQKMFLTEREMEFWRKQEAKFSVPFTYHYYEGYGILLRGIQSVGVLMLLFVSVSLSGVFAEEHVRRTDQLMLSSAKGKTTIYWAKLCAGSTVAAAGTILMVAAATVLTFGIYGSEGFQTVIQLLYHTCSMPLTMGQACLIAYGILILTSVFVSILIMVLSEALHSSMATLAVSTGVIIASMIFHIPESYRIIGPIWDSLPMIYLTLWNIFDERLITIGGHCFMSWQAVPVIYVFAGILAAAMGKRIYQKYQVSGR